MLAPACCACSHASFIHSGCGVGSYGTRHKKRNNDIDTAFLLTARLSPTKALTELSKRADMPRSTHRILIEFSSTSARNKRSMLPHGAIKRQVWNCVLSRPDTNAPRRQEEGRPDSPLQRTTLYYSARGNLGHWFHNCISCASYTTSIDEQHVSTTHGRKQP